MLSIQEAAKLCGVSLDELNKASNYGSFISGTKDKHLPNPIAWYISIAKQLREYYIFDACYFVGKVISKSKGE